MGCLPSHLVIQGRPVLEHGLGALDVQQDVGEGSDCILVAPHHHVGEAHVVEGGDLTGWHSRVQVLDTKQTFLKQVLPGVVDSE